jgi:hypothetical protein
LTQALLNWLIELRISTKAPDALEKYSITLFGQNFIMPKILKNVWGFAKLFKLFILGLGLRFNSKFDFDRFWQNWNFTNREYAQKYTMQLKNFFIYLNKVSRKWRLKWEGARITTSPTRKLKYKNLQFPNCKTKIQKIPPIPHLESLNKYKNPSNSPSRKFK